MVQGVRAGQDGKVQGKGAGRDKKVQARTKLNVSLKNELDDTKNDRIHNKIANTKAK